MLAEAAEWVEKQPDQPHPSIAPRTLPVDLPGEETEDAGYETEDNLYQNDVIQREKNRETVVEVSAKDAKDSGKMNTYLASRGHGGTSSNDDLIMVRMIRKRAAHKAPIISEPQHKRPCLTESIDSATVTAPTFDAIRKEANTQRVAKAQNASSKSNKVWQGGLWTAGTDRITEMFNITKEQYKRLGHLVRESLEARNLIGFNWNKRYGYATPRATDQEDPVADLRQSINEAVSEAWDTFTQEEPDFVPCGDIESLLWFKAIFINGRLREYQRKVKAKKEEDKKKKEKDQSKDKDEDEHEEMAVAVEGTEELEEQVSSVPAFEAPATVLDSIANNVSENRTRDSATQCHLPKFKVADKKPMDLTRKPFELLYMQEKFEADLKEAEEMRNRLLKQALEDDKPETPAHRSIRLAYNERAVALHKKRN